MTSDTPSASTALVPVFTGEIAGQSAMLCNARDLHAFLQVGRDFATWIKDRIAEYGFVDGEDYSPVLGNRSGGTAGKRRSDYHLTLDMAKELAMVENNDQGRAVRRYFIACERRAHEQPITIDPETAALIDWRAWTLAQIHVGRYRDALRDEMRQSVASGGYRGPIEDWLPDPPVPQEKTSEKKNLLWINRKASAASWEQCLLTMLTEQSGFARRPVAYLREVASDLETAGHKGISLHAIGRVLRSAGAVNIGSKRLRDGSRPKIWALRDIPHLSARVESEIAHAFG